MGAIGECCCGGCECTFAEGELPTLSIEGMHSYTGWSINCCCAVIDFEYDVEQAYTKYDGGDVMSYDKTTSRTVEVFYYPDTCGQRLKGWYIDPNSGGYPGDSFTPTEPAYTGCCPSAVTINTATIEDRVRGGRRFVLRIRPERIRVTIQKASVNCGGTTSVKYVVTSEKSYVGAYEYVDYQQTTFTQTNTSSKDCWKIPSSTLGVYPFDIATWSPSAWAIATSFSFCARKNLSLLPVGSIGFTSSDTGSDCDPPSLDCAACSFKSEVCFDSGPTGITEPSTGFCTPPSIGTRSYSLTHGPHCLQHRWAKFYRGDAPPGDPGYIYPGFLQVGNGCLSFAGSTYPPSACVDSFSYVGISSGGVVNVFNYYTGSLADPNCEVWSITCDNCYTYSPFNPTYETDNAGTTTTNYNASNAYARVVAASVSITCSGYVQQEICIPFSGWSVSVA